MAVSVLAHALLLWPSATRTARPLLHVRLRPAPVAPPITAAVASVEVPLARALPKPAPIAPAAAAARKARPKAEPEALRPPLPDTAVATAVIESMEPTGLADAESLRSYRFALALNARRFHQYPPQAIAHGLAGTAQVRVSVARNGLLGSVDLLRSSGHDSLDREATMMLARAAHATLLPDALRGHAFAVDMPIEFSLPAR